MTTFNEFYLFTFTFWILKYFFGMLNINERILKTCNKENRAFNPIDYLYRFKFFLSQIMYFIFSRRFLRCNFELFRESY